LGSTKAMKRRILTITRWAFAFVLATSAGGTFAASLVAENGPHDGWNVIPLGEAFGSGRYQQVYSSSLFPGTVSISSVAFSADQDSLYSADISLRLTTTSSAVGLLSSNLDSNFSTPLTKVYSNASFSQAIAGGSESFGLVFDFSATPFLFDPGSGNLLMDIQISNQRLIPEQYPAFTGFSQGRIGAGTAYSRAWDTAGIFGLGSDAGGLRTKIEFTATAIPEPETYLLLLAGLGLLGFVTRARREAILRH
jgi:PEP-CTERM motif